MRHTGYPQTALSATDFSTLTRLILEEIFKDFDDSRSWMRNILEMLAWPSVHRFVRIAANFDETVACSGLREAMRHVISDFASEIKLVGCENIPENGPLLIVSNHPGTYDSLAISASLPRDDLKIIAAGFPFLQRLPHASQHLIFTNLKAKSGENLSVVRAAIRHLRSGGAVLIFPSGRIDPDPAVLPGAVEALGAWSPSFELFLRKVPQTKVQFTIVSGVLSPIFLRNPLIKSWRGPGNPQNVAEIIQIITQMLFAQWVRIRPAISFGIPKTMDELLQNSSNLYQSVVAEASRLQADHIQGFV